MRFSLDLFQSYMWNTSKRCFTEYTWIEHRFNVIYVWDIGMMKNLLRAILRICYSFWKYPTWHVHLFPSFKLHELIKFQVHASSKHIKYVSKASSEYVCIVHIIQVLHITYLHTKKNWFAMINSSYVIKIFCFIFSITPNQAVISILIHSYSKKGTLHNKWSFSWRTSSVNVTKYAGNWGFDVIY